MFQLTPCYYLHRSPLFRSFNQLVGKTCLLYVEVKTMYLFAKPHMAAGYQPLICTISKIQKPF